MPLENDLFKLIEKRDYSQALTLLDSHPEIDINSINDEGYSFFMAAVANRLQTSPERHTFIERVLAHPDFKNANKSLIGLSSSPFKIAIAQTEPQLIELILKHQKDKDIEVVFDKSKLYYESQSAKVKWTQSQMKDREPSITDLLDEKKEILATLLLIAVQYAIKTDDPAILQRLADEGAKLHFPLKDGTYPMDLVREQKELKVHGWLSQYIKEKIASSPTYFLAEANLESKHGQKAHDIVANKTQAMREELIKLFKFHEYKEPPQENPDETPPNNGMS